MRTIKRLLAAGLAATTLVSVPAFAAETDGLEHFQPVAAYSDELFTDLDPNGWYMENVETAYELGLMKGVGSGSFSPDGTISLGETIALAARVHSIYETGAASFTQGSPWYQVYVDYAAQNGIFTGSTSTDYGAPATRSQFAAILAAALPEEALEPINTVDDGMIPDVPEGAANYDAIYLLYRAGVLTGSDGKGTYNPQTTIGRSSVAALVTRMVKPELRQSITLADPDKEVSVTLNRTSLSLTEGETYRLTATVRPADADVSVSWSSSNTSVASVSSDGTVTAKAEGSAVVTAKAGDATAKCTVTVEKKEDGKVTRIWIDLTSITLLDIGDTRDISKKYDYYPKDAVPPKVTWSSSDPSVATVDSNGIVTAVGKGEAEIIITSDNGKSSSCPVKVLDYGDGFVESEPPFDVPKLNYNYGPMTTVDQYVGGEGKRMSRVAQITDLEFTGWKWYDYSIYAQTVILKVHLEGTLINPNNDGGSGSCDIRILFYDADGNKLDFSGPFTVIGKESGSFSCDDEIGPIDIQVLKKTAYIEFIDPKLGDYVDGLGVKLLPGIYSWDEVAEAYGLDPRTDADLKPEPEPEPEPEPKPEPEPGDEYYLPPEMKEAVAIYYELDALNQQIFEIYNPVQVAMAGTFDRYKVDVLPLAVEACRSIQPIVNEMVQLCGDSTYWADFKAIAQSYSSTLPKAIELFTRVGNTDPDEITEADEKAVMDLYTALSTHWGDQARYLAEFSNTHSEEVMAYRYYM